MAYMEKLKTCKKCGKISSITNFKKHPKTRDGLRGSCKECDKLERRAWYIKWSSDPEKKKIFLAKCRKWSKENPEKRKACVQRYHAKYGEIRLKRLRDYWADIRNQVLDGYGNKCACCGETHKEFFAIDHIQGGGTTEKKKYGSRPIYKKIIAEGFPKDKYQILCHNCNMAIGFYGYCPHHPEIKRIVYHPNKINSSKPLPCSTSTPSSS